MVSAVRLCVSLLLMCLAPHSVATGLGFWESSSTNSALGSANGAIALDASVLALAPSSITQLTKKNISVSVTQYEVESQYEIFGKPSQYEKSNPIPSFFLSAPLSFEPQPDWFAGLAIYSRTAADISIPAIGPNFLPLFFETRVRPIVVSATPTLAYQWGSVSLAGSVEYLYSEYLLEQNRRRFGKDNPVRYEGSHSGWSGAFSMTWQPMESFSAAFTHQFESQFDDAQIAFDLPKQTRVYLSYLPFDSWAIHATYSHSDWQNKGIHFTEYGDPFGLLVGAQDSQRVALSSSYQAGDWRWMLGISRDEAIDSYGGEDWRYRAGVHYAIASHWSVTGTLVVERYAHKKYSGGGVDLVSVQNEGQAVSIGLTYQL